MKIAMGVTTALYSGICDQMGVAKLFIGKGDLLIPHMERLAEAMEFYKNHCVVSNASLEKRFEELMKLIQKREGSTDPVPETAE